MIHLRHFLQEDNKSCIPASVRMVLDYLGIKHTESEISAVLDTQKQGTGVMNIELLPSTEWGITVWTGELSAKKLKRYIDQSVPIIVAVWTDALHYWGPNRPHAIVVVGYDEKSVYLNDAKFPDAPKTVTWDDFLKAWEDFGFFAAIIEKNNTFGEKND